MAVTARNTNLKSREGLFLDGPVAANVNCIQDAIVMRDTAGRITNGATATGAVGVGVAESNRVTGGTNSGTDPEVWNNTGGSAAAFRVRYRDGIKGPFTNSGASVTAAMVGKQCCYIVDNVTVAATSGGTRSPAGLIYEVVTAGVYVLFDENLTKMMSSVSGFDGLTTLTDSTTLDGSHNDTISPVTLPTSLTDNGGGAADGTVASMAPPVTITDSTGADGTHDDTIADGLTVTALEALGATALGDLVATQNTGWGASTEAGFDSIATKFDLLVTDMTNLRAKVTTVISDITIQNQNDSDLGQKVIEIVTLLGTLQNNFKELTTAQAANRAALLVLAQNDSDLTQKVIEILAA